ncbi:MAG: methyltransferase, partial [Alphaproteobacteria bacterium]|nr:methyltransferase [Alphaproteobacteria bacterium]
MDEPIVSEDAVLGGRVRLFQPVSGYRAAIDPVLLAASIQAGGNEQVLDVGCGVGAVALCLAARLKDVRVYGI